MATFSIHIQFWMFSGAITIHKDFFVLFYRKAFGSAMRDLFCEQSEGLLSGSILAMDVTWVFPKDRGILPPKWMVKIMEDPIKMDDLGVPFFLETPTSSEE